MVSSLSKPDKRHTHYRRNLLIICLLLGIVLITFCFLLCQHDSQDMDCDCLRCLLSAPPQEGEYLYNRYLLLISVLCFLLIFLPIYIFEHRQHIKRNKKTSHRNESLIPMAYPL